jgi:hypothetical protein
LGFATGFSPPTPQAAPLSTSSATFAQLPETPPKWVSKAPRRRCSFVALTERHNPRTVLFGEFDAILGTLPHPEMGWHHPRLASRHFCRLPGRRHRAPKRGFFPFAARS